jgi:hypothetical protein
MTETGEAIQLDPVNEMRGSLRTVHQSGYKDLPAIYRFLILYDDYTVDPEGYNQFFESLDSPDIGFTYDEEVYDHVLAAYDDLGGSRFALAFPEADRVPSDDWLEELQTLPEIFDQCTRQYSATHALYVRMHAQQLREADPSGIQLQALFTNPRFLQGLVSVYDFEETESDENRPEFLTESHVPEFWPTDDGSFLESVLEAVGYQYAGSHLSDWRHEREGSTIYSTLPNLRTIAELERERIGATRYLSERFGIRHFGRYPIDLLLKQYDSRAQANRPYGVMVSAVDDHNGNFSDIPGTLLLADRLYSQAKETHDFFVAEAETSTEFEQRLKHFATINDQRYQIDFAVIETHGSPETISFGLVEGIGSLALGSKLSDARKIFSKRASILMTGCSTGQINGIAQSLSRQFNTTVVAPPVDISTKIVSFAETPEAVSLIPHYPQRKDDSPIRPVVYRKGSPLGLQKAAAYLESTPSI